MFKKVTFLSVLLLLLISASCYAAYHYDVKMFDVKLVEPETFSKNEKFKLEISPDVGDEYTVICGFVYDVSSSSRGGKIYNDGISVSELLYDAESKGIYIYGKTVYIYVYIYETATHLPMYDIDIPYNVPNKLEEKANTTSVVQTTQTTQTSQSNYYPMILNKELPISINGNYLEFYNANGDRVFPITYNGTTYLPIRALSGLFKTQIAWNGENQSILLGEGDISSNCVKIVERHESNKMEDISAQVNTKIKVYYMSNLQKFEDANGLTVYPISYQDTTYLPVRAISKLFGAQIEWNNDTREVEITYKNSSIDAEDVDFENGELNIISDKVGRDGIYINKAGECVKIYSSRFEWYSVIYSNKNNIKVSYDNKYFNVKVGYPDSRGFGIYFIDDYLDGKYDNEIDFYYVSQDGKKLVSEKRGKDFDLIKISDDYFRDDYINEGFVLNSPINGQYKDLNNNNYRIAEVSNYSFGQKKAIVVGGDIRKRMLLLFDGLSL